jgi:predicted MFS family arabinose efflux permease
MPATALSEPTAIQRVGDGATVVQADLRFSAWLRIAPAPFAVAWGGNHFTPMLHLYEQLGHYSTAATNLLLGTYVFGLIPGLLLAAAFAGRFGRRRVLIVGVLASLLGSIVLASGFPAFLLLCLGRMLAGVGTGIGMTVGTSWIAALSRSPYDEKASLAAGARRPALTLTLGFGLGAAVSGTLAQWGPWPTVLPYLVHIALALAALALLLGATEPPLLRRRQSLWTQLRVPSVRDIRFRRLIMPTAPWVFTTAGVAYALLPEIVSPRLGSHVLIFATGICVVTLGAGALVQPQVHRLNLRTRGHALSVGMFTMTVGLAVAALACALVSPAVAILAGVVLGIGFGICVVAGLGEIQRIAQPAEVAGMTGIYYSMAYLGFLLPTALSALSSVVSLTLLLSLVTCASAACLVRVSMALASGLGQRPAPADG